MIPLAQRNTGPYVCLPVEVVLDTCLGADTLALVAYRATFAGRYALHRAALDRTFGLGDDRVRRIFEEAQLSGYLTRRHARDGTKAHAKISEALTLPPIRTGYAFLRREWIANLSLRATSAYLFLAARPQGQHAFPRELKARFGWSAATANKWLNELIDQGLVMRISRKSPNGRFDGFAYACRYGSPSYKPSNNSPDDVFRDHADRDHKKGAPYITSPTTFDSSYADGVPFTFGDRDAIAVADHYCSGGASAPVGDSSFGGLLRWLEADPRARTGPETDWARRLTKVRRCGQPLLRSDLLREDLIAATGGRITRRLLAEDGLVAYGWLVGAFADSANMAVDQAHAYLMSLISSEIGDQPGKQLYSWVYIVIKLYRKLPDDGELRDPGHVRLTPATRRHSPTDAALPSTSKP